MNPPVRPRRRIPGTATTKQSDESNAQNPDVHTA